MKSICQILLASTFLLVPSLLIADDSEGEVITELAWGEALFFHFKGEKLDALTRLSARLQQQKLGPHKDRAEVLMAGILLDFGMPNHAAEKLAGLDQLTLAPDIATKLQLANARVFYEQQNFTQAEQLLSGVDFSYLSDREVTQANFMFAQLQFSTGRFTESAETLAKITIPSNLQLYAYYNQGLSLLKTNNPSLRPQAVALLQRVSSHETFDQEQYALADQAKLALALDALSNDEYLAAEQVLNEIRLNGPVSKDALLLLGWNYAKQENFDSALLYWSELANSKDILSPVVQEAWLAVPYAWHKKGDKQGARRGYEQALKVQESARQQLATLKIQPRWRSLLSDIRNTEAFTKHAELHRQLLADEGFYELNQQWQELQKLANHLQEQSRLIPILRIATEENRQRFKNKSKHIATLLANNESDIYSLKSAQLNTELQQQLKREVAPKLLTEEQQQMWMRINRSEANLKLLPKTAKTQAQLKQLEILEGVAKWQFHRQRKENEWRAQDAQNKLAHEVETLTSQHQQLSELVKYSDTPLTLDVAQLNQLQQNSENLFEEVKATQQQLELAMQTLYIAFIEARETALVQLAEQAHLALARISFESATMSENNE